MAGSAEHFANVSTKPDHLASSSPHAEIESLAPFQINRLPLQPRIFHLLLEIASRALSMRATPNQHHTRTHTRARAGGGERGGPGYLRQKRRNRRNEWGWSVWVL
jgi:hypothetical protein